ncbi:hypothetical protein [Rhizobium grahamii]|uniref:hypothetical protein n=1 Tax=Rhizobium grahamii TaxID=1120045 RepID=UPI0011B036A9|nr:hypothetical protein [Rhizobium grahamii]
MLVAAKWTEMLIRPPLSTLPFGSSARRFLNGFICLVRIMTPGTFTNRQLLDFGGNSPAEPAQLEHRTGGTAEGQSSE